MLHPPLLKMYGALGAALVVDHDVRLDRRVGHRQQGHPLVGQPPALRETLDDGAERHTLTEPLAARDVGAEVAVAQPEPLRLRAIRGQFALYGVRLVGPAPALTLVDTATQGVEQVSMSGHTRSPNRVMSSPVLPITVRLCGPSLRVSRWRSRPRRNRAPPTPPASAVMRIRPSSHAGLEGRRRVAQRRKVLARAGVCDRR